YYLKGEFLKSVEHFGHCVRLAAAHGYRRIEVANRPMHAFAGMFGCDYAGSLAEAQAAAKLAIQIGQRRAEMIAEHGAVWNLYELGDFAGALRSATRALEISRQLNARRFDAEGLMFVGLARFSMDDPQGLILLREGIEIARETPRFILPCGLGMLAMM